MKEIRYFLLKKHRWGTDHKRVVDGESAYVLDMEDLTITKKTYSELKELCSNTAADERDFWIRKEHDIYDKLKILEYIDISSEYGYQTFLKEVWKRDVARIYPEEFIRVIYKNIDAFFWCHDNKLICNNRVLMEIQESRDFPKSYPERYKRGYNALWLSEQPLNLIYRTSDKTLCVSLRLIVKKKGQLYDRKYELLDKNKEDIIYVSVIINMGTGTGEVKYVTANTKKYSGLLNAVQKQEIKECMEQDEIFKDVACGEIKLDNNCYYIRY